MIFYHASGPCLQPRRVRVSCVNIYLECARTMSADCLIKCATWRNLLCTLHCTWDALKVLQSSWHSTLERERERQHSLHLQLTNPPPPPPNNGLAYLLGIVLQLKAGSSVVKWCYELALTHSGNSHGSHNAYAALPLPLPLALLLCVCVYVHVHVWFIVSFTTSSAACTIIQ